MNGHSDLVGGVEDGTINFNEQEQCYEEVDGNVEITFETKLQNMQHTLDEMISLNGKKGKSKFGYLNTKGRRSLKRLSKFLNEIGEQEWIK
tara:strand:- start:476 stop:748 length:273 start_codon:yes stop_codon:yes gene_type:complete